MTVALKPSETGLNALVRAAKEIEEALSPCWLG
jgi:hypothetical protein